jgi:hypothetical protein
VQRTLVVTFESIEEENKGMWHRCLTGVVKLTAVSRRMQACKANKGTSGPDSSGFLDSQFSGPQKPKGLASHRVANCPLETPCGCVFCNQGSQSSFNELNLLKLKVISYFK